MILAEPSSHVDIEASGDVGIVRFAPDPDLDRLTDAITRAADAALAGGLRRLEATLPAGELRSRRALHRSGFRLEGIRRAALLDAAGAPEDVACYGRLASDDAHGPTAFSGVSNSVLPKTRVIAHVLCRDDAGRLLYLQPTYKRDWELPGGVVEPHESPRLGAAREIQEELGVDVEIGPLLVVDWMPPYLGWDDAVELIFDGGVLPASTVAAMQPYWGEIAEVHWTTPDEAVRHLIPNVAERLRLMVGLAPGEVRYLERGRLVPDARADDARDAELG